MASLGVMLAEKQYLEEQLEDVETYSEELEKVWENTEIELKQKVDAYGYVIDDITNRVNYLKAKKAKLNKIQKSLETEIENIKGRLNFHAKDNPLKGNEYTFHPFISEVTDHIEMDKVESKYKTYIVKMNATQFIAFNALTENLSYSSDKVKEDALFEPFTFEEKCGVSDLPDKHPAVIKKLTPSVRIR